MKIHVLINVLGQISPLLKFLMPINLLNWFIIEQRLNILKYDTQKHSQSENFYITGGHLKTIIPHHTLYISSDFQMKQQMNSCSDAA